ncbi:membrane protein [Streptomyces spiroverticillatus]|uniref:Membrane protein n=1 Tax=Streptomyces finlayi TaxID=67296 RepID=A0A918WUJ1_9ACTN|nr:hypothetical protein [Streptomyces finlayi]GGZ99558.1 membrane protein [Streptomyces spiroverticillatus]GHC84236.1 membrane protein [Streptomyces finlayi]
MHMNSAPHLLAEDRPEFERTLDEALRTAHERPELAAAGGRLNSEQLRTAALNAREIINGHALTEYDHYVKVRGELRAPTLPATLLAPGVGENAEATGAGAIAVVAVLTPVLAGIAAVVLLLVGFALRMLSPPPAIADALLTAGWIFGALTAAGLLGAAVGLLFTALRNGSTAFQDGHRDASTEEVDRARAAWTEALTERGIVPFLREALAKPPDPASSAPPASAPPATEPPRQSGRIPGLGYSRPDFSSPGDNSNNNGHKTRPSFTSPDFSSPDYGGPDHKPE